MRAGGRGKATPHLALLVQATNPVRQAPRWIRPAGAGGCEQAANDSQSIVCKRPLRSAARENQASAIGTTAGVICGTTSGLQSAKARSSRPSPQWRGHQYHADVVVEGLSSAGDRDRSVEPLGLCSRGGEVDRRRAARQVENMSRSTARHAAGPLSGTSGTPNAIGTGPRPPCLLICEDSGQSLLARQMAGRGRRSSVVRGALEVAATQALRPRRAGR